MTKERSNFRVKLDTFIADKARALSTEGSAFEQAVQYSHFTFALPCALCRFMTLDLRRLAKKAVEVVHTSLWESGLTATFRAMEGLARLCPEGQLEDALLAVVVETRENLRLSVVLLADGTDDLTLQLLQTLLFYWHRLCHD